MYKPFILLTLVKHPEVLHVRYKSKDTILHNLIKSKKSISDVDFVMEYGANWHAKDKDGFEPVLYASQDMVVKFLKRDYCRFESYTESSLVNLTNNRIIQASVRHI